jgi:hypothetical protein
MTTTNERDEDQPFGWAWRIKNAREWEFTANEEHLKYTLAFAQRTNLMCETEPLYTPHEQSPTGWPATIVEPQPFGWVWRINPDHPWSFTTDREHIENIRQMEADRNKHWDITPLCASKSRAKFGIPSLHPGLGMHIASSQGATGRTRDRA